MARPMDPAELKGYSLKDLPDPELTPISAEARAITIALLAVATEIRTASRFLEPAYELNKFSWEQSEPLRRAAAGGILPAGLVGRPGNG